MHERGRDTRPWVYGHRGMRGAPENTLPAFERALAHGADGVELDVRLCKSGEVIVVHDADFKRVAQRDERVAELNLTELRRIDLGGGVRAPMLTEVLDFVLGKGKRVNVEIKFTVPDLSALCSATAELLLARTPDERSRIVVSSFHPDALRQVQARVPDQAVGFLYESFEDAEQRPRLPHYGEHPDHRLLDADTMLAIRARAAFVNTWTVNDADSATRLAALGVDAIISDVPDVVLAAL